MNSHLRRIAFLSTCALIWVFSGAAMCTPPGNDDDDSPPAGLTLAQFTQKLCAKFDSCSATHGRMFSSTSECISLYTDLFSCSGFFTVDYQPTAAEACANALASLDCGSLLGDDAPQGCEQVFSRGSANAGQACNETMCADGLYCDYNVDDGTCEVCQAKKTAGQSCSGHETPCAKGLYCDSNDQCATQKSAEASCDAHEQCVTSFCQQNTCKAKLARDASCTADDLCVGFLTCVNGACTDAPLAGESCTDVACTEMYRCVNDVCEKPDLCPSPTALGEDCSSTYTCVDGAYCDYQTEVCKAYLAIDDDCSDYSESCDYNTAFCDYNATPPVCTAKIANGQSCGSDFECRSSFCGTDDTCADAPACTMP